MRPYLPPRAHDRRLIQVFCASTLLICLAAGLRAQGTVIDSGMTRDSVIKRLGPPLSIRTFGSHTYLMYANGCEKNCGMNDLVTLDSGKVVDAIFRAPDRRYSGKSTSPQMIPAFLARGGAPADSTGVPRHVVVPPGATPPVPAKKPSEAKPEPEKRVESAKKAETEKKPPGGEKAASPTKAAAPAAKSPAPAGKTGPNQSADTTKKPAPGKKPS